METGFYIFLSIVFWTASLCIVHTYAVYPHLLRFMARGKKLPEERYEDDDEFPEVVALMAAYNEEQVIGATLVSVIASDYPLGKLRVLIGSDGSVDRTHDIVNECHEEFPWIELRKFGGRNGKIPVVNMLAKEALADLSDPESAIFLLCDANVSWTPSMVRNAVRHFKREKVGLVGASIVDVRLHQEESRAEEGIRKEEESYISQENLAKFRESVLWGTAMGAFGACYCVRASLFRTVPGNFFCDDFFQTMNCLERGHEAIVDIEAVANEAVSEDIQEEFKRKRRIALGNFQNLGVFKSLFHPLNGRLALCFAFWSHKGLRWNGPVLLFLAHVSCLLLTQYSHAYWIPMLALVMTWLMASIDYLLSRLESSICIKFFRFVRYFYWMNSAIVLGYISFAKGVTDSIWEPTHRVDVTRSLSRTG